MADKKETMKKVVKKAIKKAKVKITKTNGNVIFRDYYEGLRKQYEAKKCKVEEV